jgi:serine/threonine-protein kinase
MEKCFECSTDISAADRFCPNCGINLPTSQPESASGESLHDRGSLSGPADLSRIYSDIPPATPLEAEIFSVDSRDSDVDSEPVEQVHGSGVADPSDLIAVAEEDVLAGDDLFPEASEGEEEVEVGGLNVAIVGIASEGEEEELPPIEAEPEEFLPDVSPVDAVSEKLISVEPEPEDIDESDMESTEPPESFSDEVIELTPEIRGIYPSGRDSVQASADDSDSGAEAKVPTTGGGGRASKLQPLAEGTVLAGRYEIARKIGGGGMGAVYLAKDLNLGGAPRAVKEMVQSYIESEQQEKAINDFKRESLLLTSLDHQSIPTIYDYFFDEGEGRFYLVMKYIGGGDLSGRLRAAAEGRLDEETVTRWAIDIADVLDYLHRHEPPIVYRDLKPANVMLDANSGRAMLIDFGIARWINKEEKGVTAVGTMGYAPPELFGGNVEPRSDIYSLGSTMFHLLTGADPQSNPLLIFDFGKNPRPRQINPRISEQMEVILMRAVQYDPGARFASANEFRSALERHLDDLEDGRATFGAAPAEPEIPQQKVFCGHCGKPLLATDMFCASCGKQQAAMSGITSPTFKAKTGIVRLMVLESGGLDSVAFILERDSSLIGRRDPGGNIFPEVDLSKFDPSTKISRRHARISRTLDGFVVEDLGSSNGTFLTRGGGMQVRLLKGQTHQLMAGDVLRLGDTSLRFTVE